MVAAKLAKMPVGKPSSNSANLQNNNTAGGAAEMLNVSERSVNTAKVVQREGAPELVQAVEEGRASEDQSTPDNCWKNRQIPGDKGVERRSFVCFFTH